MDTTLTNQNSSQEEIKSRLKSENTCHHAIKIKIYKTIILPVFLYGCETSSLTLSEERRLVVFENRALKRIFGPKKDDVTREGSKLYNEELNDLYSSPNFVRVIKLRRMRWTGHVRVWERREAYTWFWWGKLRERDSAVDGSIILRSIFRKWAVEVWTRWSWLRIGTGDVNL